ncbi:GAF domain-containing protein [Streptomyces fumanus]|uniref:GAF domain-containing protein n=2 Tax=Streptomyces fumanus TaxID=67302 RepID=A0A919E054_9ACTN|nr:GAF domain-containing protein [Streptomyces fumanus]
MTVRELLARLSEAVGARGLSHWAAQCARVCGLDGLFVSLRPGGELVWFSDDTSARLADLQFTLGQGPEVGDTADAPLQVTDLAADDAGRWGRFAAEAAALDVRAVFVWPVRSGQVQLGELTGYRRTPGPLSAGQSAAALRIADSLADRLLAWRPDTDDPRDGPGTAGAIELHRAEVHQATGMLAARYGISLDEALLRLRAHAFAGGRSLTDTARALLHGPPPDT